MTPDNKSIDEIAREMDKAIKCLAIELPESVWLDVNKKWVALKSEIYTAGSASKGQQGEGVEAIDDWISVKDSPLFTSDKNNIWTLTENGQKEIIAAVPYNDNRKPTENNLWWIRHCVIDDGGLKVVGDDDNEPAGWSLEDVTHYQLLPNPPIKPTG